MKKRVLIAGLIFAGLAGYFLFVKTRSRESKPPVVPVTKRFVAAEGKVEALPNYDVEVGSDLTGRIGMLNVKEGDLVKKGQVIVKIENRDFAARLKQAEATLIVAKSKLKEVAAGARDEEIKRAKAALEGALSGRELAKSNIERSKGLYGKGQIPESEMDEADNRYKLAVSKVKEALEELRLLEKGPKQETLRLLEDEVAYAGAEVEYYASLLKKTVIEAPISGRVIRRYLNEGEVVRPELPILSIADMDRIRINAEVDETDIGRVRPGDPAEVVSYAYPDKVFKGDVREIADYVGARKIKPNNPAVNLGMKVVQVKIGLKEATPLRLGMTVDVRISPAD